jgi:hypothetical protein
MIPDIIVALPRDVPLPQFRLFQRVRVYIDIEFLDEGETHATGLVVGWKFVTKEAIADNPKNGFYPRWIYGIQFDPGYRFATVGEPEWIEQDCILEIVDE